MVLESEKHVLQGAKALRPKRDDEKGNDESKDTTYMRTTPPLLYFSRSALCFRRSTGVPKQCLGVLNWLEGNTNLRDLDYGIGVSHAYLRGDSELGNTPRDDHFQDMS